TIVIVAIAACVCVSLFALRAVNELRNAVQHGGSAGHAEPGSQLHGCAINELDCQPTREMESSMQLADLVPIDAEKNAYEPLRDMLSNRVVTVHALDENSDGVHLPQELPDLNRSPAIREQEHVDLAAEQDRVFVPRASSDRVPRALSSEATHSPDRFELAVLGSSDGIWDWNTETDECFFSERYKELLGYSGDEFPHHFESFLSHLHPDDRRVNWDAMQRHLQSGIAYDVTYRLRTKEGSWRWFRAKGMAVREASGPSRRMAGSISDITAFKQIEEQLAMDARHDRLTGLPNRVLLLERLQHCIERSKRNNSAYAVMFLDFDRFKLINDSLGHEAGDELLRQIAVRLRENTRALDCASRASAGHVSARLGGDEFVVLLEEMAAAGDAQIVAERLLAAFEKPYNLSGQRAYSTASIGIVLGDPLYQRAEDVLRDADTAMYEAKRHGKARYVIFDEPMRHRVKRRQELERDLHHAIENSELRLDCEPVVDLESGRMHSIEFQLWWQHAVMGRVDALEFMPIAEESGISGPLATWTLRAACKQFVDWKNQLGSQSPRAFCVNLSRKQFQQPGLPQEIVELLTEWQIEPNCLQLEITEDAIAGELQLAVQRIKALKEHGVAVAIDNFGVGNSSFTALHRLPVDVLKIDPSLLIDLQHSQEAASLIHGLAVIVRNIGIRLVALGISESTQLIALQGLGCDYAQGRYLGSPMPSEQLAQYIDEQSVRTYGICGAAVMAEAWTERLPEIDPLIEQGR
ncbi:MAG: hypothetical protein RIS70_2153, partial [Planctomycetota bacterium]